jgi:hypothetical protein
MDTKDLGVQAATRRDRERNRIRVVFIRNRFYAKITPFSRKGSGNLLKNA